jgi:hypothetical protein
MTKTKFYYLTTDAVNADTALGLAPAEGIDLEIAEPRDLPRLEGEGAEVILDWDFVPAEDRSRLLDGSAARLAGVHGYHLSDSVASFLLCRGTLVSRHLDRAFVATLAGPSRAA